MKEEKKSIWGAWWVPHRIWFYPVWLIYETSSRFYYYSEGVYFYLETHQESITPYLGEIGAQILYLLCSGLTFLICTAFLTVPAGYILYKLFKEVNLTQTRVEASMKMLF